MTVIPPDPGAIVIEVVRRAASPGVTMSDVLRWVGVVVAVAGAVLATPHGIASLWRGGRRWHRQALAFGRRLLRRPQHMGILFGAGGGGISFPRRASEYKWQPWRPLAARPQKSKYCTEQVEILLERINRLYALVDEKEVGLRAEIRKTADGLASQIRRLESDLRGERDPGLAGGRSRVRPHRVRHRAYGDTW